MLFGAQVMLSAAFAYDGHPRNWEIAGNLVKTLLFCLLMPMVVTNRLRIHALVLMIAISTGYHGLLDGLKFLVSGGQHFAAGIQKFGDNNHFAIVLNMVLPLLLYCYRYAANRIVRWGFLALIPLVVLAIAATQSRGGMVCLVVVAFLLILTSRRKTVGLAALALCALLVVQLVPDKWTQRMDTIGDAGQDSSLQARFGAWRVSSAVALANPGLGGGIHSVEIGSVWNSFRDAPNLLWFVEKIDMNGLPGRGRAAHSIYFETLGDLGFAGFFLFIAILGNAFVTAREVMRLARQKGAQLDWARDLAQMLFAAVLAYAVGGGLLSAAYFELPYILCMMLEVLKMQAQLTSNSATET
jgi:probable O-glycosylation ligase (exosortase A-associated)